MSDDKKQEFWKYLSQIMLRTDRDAKICNGQGNVFIDDWEGFNLKSFASKAGIACYCDESIFSLRRIICFKVGLLPLYTQP